ncbi:18147_t:CDS:10, partial [Entrophospora sp. SA101]
LEQSINKILKYNDPLDGSDFNPIEYINQIIPNEHSLASIDVTTKKLQLKMRQIEGEIRELTRLQVDDQQGVEEVEQAKKEIEELFERISQIRDKAAQSVVMVQEITQDIKSLDYAKKHLTLSITALKRLQMLVTAVDQLKIMAEMKQYKETSQLLQAVLQLAAFFKKYRNIQQIAVLLSTINTFQNDLKKQIFNDFESSFGTDGSLNVQTAPLDEASKDKPDDDLENEEVTNNNQTNGDFDRSLISARQPKLVTGGILRDYQLTGFEWLVSLYDNGLNGILADEMGLGKTLQTIAFLAYLWENKIYGPFLIVAPLSTLANWVKRAHMRSRRLKKIDHTFPIVVTSYEIVMNDRKYLQKYAWKYIVVDEGHRIKNLNCKLIRELKTYQSANRLLLTGTPLQNNLAELWSLLNFLLPDIFDDLDNGETVILAKEQQNEVVSNLHRILKPFLLRRLKSDVEYALPKKKEFLLYAPLTRQQKEVYDAILSRNIRPFLLGKKLGRELDGDTMVDPMDIDNVDFLDNNETNSNQNENNKDNNQNAIQNADNNSTSSNNNDIINNNPDSISESYIRGSKLRRLKPRAYKEMTDDEFFDVIEKGEDEISQEELLENNIIAEKETKTNRVVKSVNCMKLQNAVMQLRKICNHPYLFDWPVDPETDTYQISKELIAASGKMILLKRLLDALFERDHKVLIFSQFTTMLDIIEDWATTYENWQLCRIDGSIDQETRRKQIQEFNTNPKIKLFILSTRAGGLGINLTAADTVIIYDSDWNPQIDLQAQDRVHRIGQTRPVIIYRMVTANTIECKILEKASAKRKLEKLVIHKGKFKLPTSRDNPIASLAELEEILAGEDNEKVQLAQLGDEIIPDTDLVRLLDRSEEAFEKVGTAAEQEERGRIFKVISEVRDQNNDALAQMSNQD